MNNNRSILCSALIALSIVVLGFCIKGGIDNFANKDRKVAVKGLAEKEVDADKVTWPIVSKEIGNELPELYTRLGNTQSKIKHFLVANGIKAEEISVNAPKVIDQTADQYSELLKEGVAIVDGGWDNPVKYEYVSFRDMKPKMMEEAIANAEKTAEQFAKNSKSNLNKIVSADQGQFSIEDRDQNTPYIKKVRVVTTIVYSLKN